MLTSPTLENSWMLDHTNAKCHPVMQAKCHPVTQAEGLADEEVQVICENVSLSEASQEVERCENMMNAHRVGISGCNPCADTMSNQNVHPPIRVCGTPLLSPSESHFTSNGRESVGNRGRTSQLSNLLRDSKKTGACQTMVSPPTLLPRRRRSLPSSSPKLHVDQTFQHCVCGVRAAKKPC